MYGMRPKTQPDRVESGMFMIFAGPLLLVLGLIQGIFWIVGWLFDQKWFYILLAVWIVASLIGSLFV